MVASIGQEPIAQGIQQGKCPNCKTRIQKQDGEFLFVKNAIIMVNLRTSCSYAKCPRCKIWLGIPLKYAD